MPNHLSILGIIHTIISVVALFTGVRCLIIDGKIIPKNSRGGWYILLTTVTCLTAFPIMKTGHFTVAHSVGLIILILLILGTYVKAIGLLKPVADYLQVVLMSSTLFLSCIPAIVETLTRLPISHPLASGPNDPLIQKAMGLLAFCFLVGVVYQLFKIKSSKKHSNPPSDMKLG